jgi:hypothetical protein
VSLISTLRRTTQPVDLRTRESRAAQGFMARKGLPDIRPLGALKIDDMACWYYYYLTPECVVELEVLAQGYDFVCTVTATVYPERPQLIAS